MTRRHMALDIAARQRAWEDFWNEAALDVAYRQRSEGMERILDSRVFNNVLTRVLVFENFLKSVQARQRAWEDFWNEAALDVAYRQRSVHGSGSVWRY